MAAITPITSGEFSITTALSQAHIDTQIPGENHRRFNSGAAHNFNEDLLNTGIPNKNNFFFDQFWYKYLDLQPFAPEEFRLDALPLDPPYQNQDVGFGFVKFYAFWNLEQDTAGLAVALVGAGGANPWIGPLGAGLVGSAGAEEALYPYGFYPPGFYPPGFYPDSDPAASGTSSGTAVEVRPGGCAANENPFVGWPVTPTSNSILFDPGANRVRLVVCFAGVKPAP